MVRNLDKRETEYMRLLQRSKVGVDDFEQLIVIGKGALGEVMNLIGDVKEKVAVMVDDMIDTAARSDVICKYASMWYLPLVSFLYYFDRPERRFINRYVEARNPDAILRHRMTYYFWIGHRVIGIDLLTRATT
ncbi:hypothetical protein AHAS_Ahas18G0206200 [Arachis hypogaea]